MAEMSVANVVIATLVVALAATAHAGTPFLVLDETADWEVVW